MANQAILFNSARQEKSHGRIEFRKCEFYDVLELAKDERWETCQIKTAIKVHWKTEAVKSGKNASEESYYLRNEIGNYEELAQAVRQHWSVETNNHIRDVSLREDEMRSKKKSLQKTMAEIRTLAVTILENTKCQNKKAQLEDFADDFDYLVKTLKVMNFL